MRPAALLGAARWHARRMPERLVERGLPPARLGWRWVASEEPAAYAARTGKTVETIHAARRFPNPLPANVANAADLNPDPGWWGYAMADVPNRLARATEIVTVPDCRIVAVHNERGQFNPAVLTRDGRALALPQSAFRPAHGALLRSGAEPVRIARATWILERVYHNHSHWLTSHLPKISLLAGLGRLDGLLLPERRTAPSTHRSASSGSTRRHSPPSIRRGRSTSTNSPSSSPTASGRSSCGPCATPWRRAAHRGGASSSAARRRAGASSSARTRCGPRWRAAASSAS